MVLEHIRRLTNIQDEASSIVVANPRKTDNPFARSCIVDDGAKIGERVVLTSCRIGRGAVIGDDCKISEGAIVESGAVLEQGTVVPAGRLVPKDTRWGGNPAKYLGVVDHDHH